MEASTSQIVPMASSSTAAVSTGSFNNNNNDKNINNDVKVKEINKENKWICLPKRVNGSSRTFMVFKLFLCFFFTASFIYEVSFNVICVKHYNSKIRELRDSEIWPPRTRIQVESTNAHFFLFTALMVGGAVLVGIFAILTENLIILGGYSYIHGVVVGFEIMGAWQSYDREIIIRKSLGIAPEPIMIILALLFAHMCRNNERSLSKSPLFKQFMATKAGKGETMSDPNYKLGAELELQNEQNNNNNINEKDKKITLNDEEKGYVNDAFDQKTEEFNKSIDKNNATSTTSSYSSLPEAEKEMAKDIASPVTVTVDDKTRIAVSTSSPS